MKFTATSGDDEILHGHQPDRPVDPLFHVALIEPEIPQNTGNIGRTCVGTRSDLHLVGPLGFAITDKNLKRAGLDYWQHLSWKHHATESSWRKEIRDPKRVFYFSAFGEKRYTEIAYQKGDWFVFGRETKGLPDDMLQQNRDQVLLIPILGPVRGYNVATSAAIVLFEALRQVGLNDPTVLAPAPSDT